MIKYIIAGFLLVSCFIIVGTKLIKFNSKPNQINGQELFDRALTVPRNMPIIITLTKIKFTYV